MNFTVDIIFKLLFSVFILSIPSRFSVREEHLMETFCPSVCRVFYLSRGRTNGFSLNMVWALFNWRLLQYSIF